MLIVLTDLNGEVYHVKSSSISAVSPRQMYPECPMNEETRTKWIFYVVGVPEPIECSEDTCLNALNDAGFL